MPEESTTPGLVELARHGVEVGSRHDLDAVMGFYSPEAVFDLSDAGIGTFEGVEAIRAFFEDWWASWRSHHAEVEEAVDLGHGVVFAVVRESGRPVGSDGQVEQRGGWVVLWVRGAIERQSGYLDIDEGRAAAERLAQERADG